MKRYRSDMAELRTGPGRPRSAKSRQGALDAAFDLLLERGYGGASIEAIAQRSGVAKTTIYRLWPNRAAVVIESFFEATKEFLEFPVADTPELEFRAQVTHLAALLRCREGAALLELVAGAQHDAVLRDELYKRWILPRKVWGEERMKRLGKERIDVLLNALYGPLYARVMFGMPPLSEAEVAFHLDLFFAGLTAVKQIDD